MSAPYQLFKPCLTMNFINQRPIVQILKIRRDLIVAVLALSMLLLELHISACLADPAELDHLELMALGSNYTDKSREVFGIPCQL